MSKSGRKAPAGTFWRGNTLHGRSRVAGKLLTWSLETDNPKLAAERRKAGRDRVIALRHGDAKLAYEDVLERWAKWIVKQVGPATTDRYSCSLAQLDRWLKNRKLVEIDAKLIATIIDERGEHVSNATLKRDLGALSSVLNFCIDRGWREDNPVLPRLRRVKERRDPIVLPDANHIKIAIERAPSAMGRLILAAMITGARQGELLRLRRDHIDDARRQLTLIGKGNKLRVIDLALYGGYDILTGLRLAEGSADRYIFWHGDGQPYMSNSFKSNFVKFMKATVKWAAANGVEFRPFRFHDLRHWHAVHFLKDGCGSIYDLQQRLGHSTVVMTEGYLKYLTPEEQRTAKGGIAKSIADSVKSAIPETSKVPVESA